MSCFHSSEGENRGRVKWDHRPFIGQLANSKDLGRNAASATCHVSTVTEGMRRGGGSQGKEREVEKKCPTEGRGGVYSCLMLQTQNSKGNMHS
jgi:hypothetical protein